MKVYVAASAAPDQSDRVRAAIDALRAADITVTCTWPEIVAATPGGANPRAATDVDRAAWSAQDLKEIDAADAVWFLVPTPPATTRGAWFEVGYAHAKGKRVVFSGDTKQSVFCALGHEFVTDEAALLRLIAYAAPVPVSPIPPSAGAGAAPINRACTDCGANDGDAHAEGCGWTEVLR